MFTLSSMSSRLHNKLNSGPIALYFTNGSVYTETLTYKELARRLPFTLSAPLVLISMILSLILFYNSSRSSLEGITILLLLLIIINQLLLSTENSNTIVKAAAVVQLLLLLILHSAL